MKAIIIVPTLNAGDTWSDWVRAVKMQSTNLEVVVIDSGSDDETREIAEQAGFSVNRIKRQDFDHGGTRQSALGQLQGYDVVIFLTQDAILQGEHSIRNLLRPFEQETVAAVCGRQCPSKNATAISAHARLFNYPDKSFVRQLSDKDVLGIKAAFLSNSFAAYRVSSLMRVGGFPDGLIFGEDMYVAARLLMSGEKIAYAADACVLHSHNYSLIQEFKRYFDNGVLHARQPWIMDEFGSAEDEGRKFFISETGYLMRHAFWKLPEAFIRSILKYAGFRLGRIEQSLPHKLKVACSMNTMFFEMEK